MKTLYFLFFVIAGVFSNVTSAQSMEEIVLYVTDIRGQKDIDSSFYGWYLLHGINLKNNIPTNVIFEYCKNYTKEEDSLVSIQKYDVILLYGIKESRLFIGDKKTLLGPGRANSIGIRLDNGESLGIVSISINNPLHLYWGNTLCNDFKIPVKNLYWRKGGNIGKQGNVPNESIK